MQVIINKMKQPVRGINLGGWLVVERWMTPHLFEGVSDKGERALSEQLGFAEAKQRLKHHRDSFITQEHIERIAVMGLGVVRLPVGYWLFGDKPPFVDGGHRYVDQLFNWAEKYGLKVILDVHGAPGSQNGHDHSGQTGRVGWHLEPKNIDETVDFVAKLCDRYAHSAALIGVEVLNEPSWDIGVDVLIDYYRRAADIIRAKCDARVAVIVSDAFHPKEMSKALRRARLGDVVLDAHLYQLYTPEDRALNLEGHLKKTNQQWRKLLKKLSRHHPLLIGEWSAAMSELYEPVPTEKPRRPFSSEDYRQYAAVQRAVFDEVGASWTYWNARTQDGGIWSGLDHPELFS